MRPCFLLPSEKKRIAASTRRYTQMEVRVLGGMNVLTNRSTDNTLLFGVICLKGRGGFDDASEFEKPNVFRPSLSCRRSNTEKRYFCNQRRSYLYSKMEKCLSNISSRVKRVITAFGDWSLEPRTLVIESAVIQV